MKDVEKTRVGEPHPRSSLAGSASGLARGLDPVWIALAVAKFERVFADMGRGQQDEAGVQYLREPFIRPDPSMMVATRADRQIFFPLLDEHHLAAGRAFVPQRFGGGLLLGEGQGVADAVDPAHAAVSWA